MFARCARSSVARCGIKSVNIHFNLAPTFTPTDLGERAKKETRERERQRDEQAERRLAKVNNQERKRKKTERIAHGGDNYCYCYYYRLSYYHRTDSSVVFAPSLPA